MCIYFTCDGHLSAVQPSSGDLVARVNEDRCVCCGTECKPYMKRHYIREQVWVCQPKDTALVDYTCCYYRAARIDHSVSFEGQILRIIDQQLRAVMR